MGRLDAGAVLIEFSDFECPYCQKFGTEILPALETKYINTGRLLFAFRNLPLKIHANAEQVAKVATCAAEQQKFKPFHDLLFEKKRELDFATLEGLTRQAGVDSAALRTCLESTAPLRVTADKTLADSLGITGTPTFFVGKALPDNTVSVRRVISGAKPVAEFVAAIDEVLQAKVK